jgi:hypothetical protein
MSWDVFIQHMPASALRFADIPEDYTPLPLGTVAEVVAVIQAVFPDADASDPTWVTVETPAYSIECGLGTDDPVSTIALHIRGDDSVVEKVAELIDRLGARAIDSWTGDFFDADAALDSIRRWRNYVGET